MAELRALPSEPESDASIPIHELGTRLRDGFGADEVPWLYGVVESLSKDGLAAVAEDAPAFDAEAVTLRVKLP